MSEAARGRATGQAFLTYDVVVDTVVEVAAADHHLVAPVATLAAMCGAGGGRIPS